MPSTLAGGGVTALQAAKPLTMLSSYWDAVPKSIYKNNKTTLTVCLTIKTSNTVITVIKDIKPMMRYFVKLSL